MPSCCSGLEGLEEPPYGQCIWRHLEMAGMMTEERFSSSVPFH